MNALKIALLFTLLITAACQPVRPVVVGGRPNYPHDNGKHKGWYKNGRYGMPPGQAKKYGGLPPGQAKKRSW